MFTNELPKGYIHPEKNELSKRKALRKLMTSARIYNYEYRESITDKFDMLSDKEQNVFLAKMCLTKHIGSRSNAFMALLEGKPLKTIEQKLNPQI